MENKPQDPGFSPTRDGKVKVKCPRRLLTRLISVTIPRVTTILAPPPQALSFPPILDFKNFTMRLKNPLTLRL